MFLRCIFKKTRVSPPISQNLSGIKSQDSHIKKVLEMETQKEEKSKMKNLVQMARFPTGLGLRKKDGISQFDGGANE